MRERERVVRVGPHTTEGTLTASPEALIEEARRRQRRRRGISAFAVLLVAGAVGIAWFGWHGGSGSGSSPATSGPAGAFDRATARAGETITVSFGAMPASTQSPWSTHRSVLVSFTLLPLQLASRWWPIYNSYGFSWGPPPHLRQAKPLGSGQISFVSMPPARYRVRVPNVPAGKYVIAYTGGGARWTSARPDWQIDPHGILRITSE